MRWIERLYGLFFRLYAVFFLALGALFLYWGVRGLLAYQAGTRAAWTDPLACAAGLVAGVLSLWTGVRLMPGKIALGRTRGVSAELQTTLDIAMELEQTDPAAAQQLLDSYFMREAAAEGTRRMELRQRAPYDVAAALELRRRLQEDLTSNVAARNDILKDVPEPERTAMVTQIDAAQHDLQTELVDLDNKIDRLKLR
jgi:hypothetical protein